ncbi:MAG: ATP-binding cassette domain-containing protein, partial [Thauera sp.]|nr:ATP-binding cassette domain-containing protein [Thauera sp.]
MNSTDPAVPPSGGSSPLPSPVPSSPPLLCVTDLGVVLDRGDTELRPVDGVDLSIAAGETYALLGESGCGKSMTALALTRLLPDSGRIERGEVRLDGEDLLRLPESAMRKVRG